MESKLCLFKLNCDLDMTVEQYTALLSRLKSGEMFSEFGHPDMAELYNGDAVTGVRRATTISTDRVAGVWERPQFIRGELHAVLRCAGPFGDQVFEMWQKDLLSAKYRTIAEQSYSSDGKHPRKLVEFVTWDICMKDANDRRNESLRKHGILTPAESVGHLFKGVNYGNVQS